MAQLAHIAARRLPGPMSDAEEDADAFADDADDVDDGDTDALNDAFAGVVAASLTCVLHRQL